MRYALGIEYDGTDFRGWQRLGDGSASLQGALEAALSFVAGHPLDVVCAGRTDSGVHGRCQVVHFDSHAERSEYAWLMGTATRLPRSMTVRWVQPVPEDFHARFAARARRYRYRILNRRVRPALDARFVAWERLLLDANAMHTAAQLLLGEHDFSAFRSSQCQAAHARRDLQQLDVTRHDDEVHVSVQANAFLHHMVRNLVGSLLPIGRGEKPMSWMRELLDGRDRSLAGPTAAPQGLLFIGPLYPAHWGLPAEVTL
ncbi:tRNA pseudouridine(38-40) synthase TruA [Xanthomonadaceae bacterium JHOS43]|nr:tRNA pseudouridine(38-40) synthase TruA [Xanthomonadaceae bacterium JHOS43]